MTMGCLLKWCIQSFIFFSVEDEEGGTDTQMIMDTDSADAVGEGPNEEGNNIYM